MTEEKRQEDFVTKVFQNAGNKFFSKDNIQALRDKQREIFNLQTPAKQQALDNMFNKVMQSLKKKHKEQVLQLLKYRKQSNEIKAQNPQQLIASPQNKKIPEERTVEGNQIRVVESPNQKISNEESQYSEVQQLDSQKQQQTNSTIVNQRQKSLKDSFYDIPYTYEAMKDQAFKKLYIAHIIDVIDHIQKNEQNTTFLTRYQLQSKEKYCEQVRVKVPKGDSDFVLNKGTEALLVSKLKEEKQVIFWMWSFAHMIDEMQSIGVYHLDLKISNTIKLGRIFRCIDYEYSFFINKTTKQSIKEMLKQFNETGTFVFQLMETRFDGFAEKQYNKKIRQNQIKNIYQKFRETKNKISQLIKQAKLQKQTKLQQAYQQFQKYLKQYHKISFAYQLLYMLQLATLPKTKEDQILKIIEKLDLENKNVNVYRQFIKAIKELNSELAQRETIPLRYIQKLREKEQAHKDIKQIKQIAVNKLKSFANWMPYDSYQFIAPIFKDSIREQEKGIYCDIRNSCRSFGSPLDFWELNKPRYLHYLFKGVESALNILQKANIYFTHLSITDLVLEGQFFKIKTLQNAVMLARPQPKQKINKLLRQFIQHLDLILPKTQKMTDISRISHQFIQLKSIEHQKTNEICKLSRQFVQQLDQMPTKTQQMKKILKISPQFIQQLELMPIRQQQMNETYSLSHQYIRKLVGSKDLQILKIASLQPLYEPQWFRNIPKQLKLGDPYYEQLYEKLIKYLRKNKCKILFQLLKSLFDKLPKEQAELFTIQKTEVNLTILKDIRSQIKIKDKYISLKVFQRKKAEIFKTLQKLQQENPGQSFIPLQK